MPCMYDLLSRKKDMREVDLDAPAKGEEQGAPEAAVPGETVPDTPALEGAE